MISADSAIFLLSSAASDTPPKNLESKKLYCTVTQTPEKITVGYFYIEFDRFDTCISLLLDSGKIISVFQDTQIMGRDGSYISAKNLKIGTSLMPLYTKLDHGTIHYKENTEYYKGGLAECDRKAFRNLARLSAEFKIKERLPDKVMIRRKKGDGHDYSPESITLTKKKPGFYIRKNAMGPLMKEVRELLKHNPKNHKIVNIIREENTPLYNLKGISTDNVAVSGIFIKTD